MTYKIALDFTPAQIEGLVEQLPMKDKIRLVRKLEKQTWASRFQELFDRVDARRKKSGITSKEVWKEVKQARKEFYAGRA